jgi:hypothetical protein
MCVLRDNADYEEVDVHEAEGVMKGLAVRVGRLIGQVVKSNEVLMNCLDRDDSNGLPFKYTSGVCNTASVVWWSSGGPGSIPGTTSKRSSGSGMGSTQLREYN